MAERPLPPHVMMVSEAPHDWLFPRMAAVVHHGGSGTVAAGLRAGRPSVLCTIFGDQPIWARRLRDLGVAPEALPMRRLSSAALASAIRTATSDDRMAAKAETLGAMLRRERGVGTAVSAIERTIAEQRKR